MGAVVNLRPDLFKAVIATCPFVDVINTMLDETLPLTVGEFEEWGNPKVREQYGWIKAYYPYTNVKRDRVPGDAGEHVVQRQPGDVPRAGQVGRAAARDEVGRQPAAAGDEHGRRPWRGSGPLRPLREIAFDYAYILRHLGRADPSAP